MLLSHPTVKNFKNLKIHDRGDRRLEKLKYRHIVAIVVQTDNIAYLNLAIKQQVYVKKLQFMHTVNGDGSKTAKIIKRHY